jgi:hypothetical protein
MAESWPFIPRALDDAGLDVYAFRVFCRILRRAGDGRGACYESLPRMAAALGIWRLTVRRAVRDLAERGMVRVESRPGRTGLLTPLPPEGWRPGRVSDLFEKPTRS